MRYAGPEPFRPPCERQVSRPVKRQWLSSRRWAAALVGVFLLSLVAAPIASAAPTVTITSPQNGQEVTAPTLTVAGTVANVTGTASGTVSVNGGAPQSVTVSGGSFNGSVTLSAGANSIAVTITDTNQQTGSSSHTATASVTLQTAPVVTLGTPAVSGTTITFNGTVSDAMVTRATVIYNGQALKAIAVSGGSFSSFVPAACGNPTLAVSATNGAGTGTSATQTVAVGTACSGGSAGGSGGGPVVSQPGAASVGSGGGALASADGSFTMTVPAGELPGGTSLSVSTSLLPPGGVPALPTGEGQASSYITLSGGTLSAPVPATVKYNGASLGSLDPQRLSAYADGAWHYLPTSVDASSGAVTVNITGPETLLVLANTQKFGDVTSGYWARASIDTLLGAGVVDGFPDGTFQPDATLTRAQFVKMLDLTLGLAPGAMTTSFTDVAPTAWYAPDVAAAVAAGLVQGVSATSFAPDASMTREQMAVLVARAMKLTKAATLTFSDATSIDGWATAGVQAAVAAAYLNGFPDGTLQPLGPVTRAQASQVLAKAIANLAPRG